MAEVTKTLPSAEPTEAIDIGKNAKLNELMMLVAVAAADDIGAAKDLDRIRYHANRAAAAWEARQAARPAIDDTAQRFIELLRQSDGVQGVHIDYDDCAALADALEAIPNIEGAPDIGDSDILDVLARLERAEGALKEARGLIRVGGVTMAEMTKARAMIDKALEANHDR